MLYDLFGTSKSLGTTVTNKMKFIMKRINSEYYCNCSVQKLLISCVLSRTLNIKLYIKRLFCQYGCETWFPTLRQEHNSKCLKTKCSPKERRSEW
jgi:hypothetical protein